MIRRLVVLMAAAALVAACATGGDDEFAEIPGLGATRVDVPRPTGAASAPCDDDPLPAASDETTLERVTALRGIGLFGDRADVSDADLSAEVDANLEALWGPDLALDDPVRDLAVAEQDASRVLWIDLDADVAAENQVYASTLEGLQDISVGAFQPTNVVETWEDAEGPIRVEFDLGGTRRALTPTYLEDWIDPGILVTINEAIADTGRRFELYRAFDQTALIMALTDDERSGLEARGWCFE